MDTNYLPGIHMPQDLIEIQCPLRYGPLSWYYRPHSVLRHRNLDVPHTVIQAFEDVDIFPADLKFQTGTPYPARFMRILPETLRTLRITFGHNLTLRDQSDDNGP